MTRNNDWPRVELGSVATVSWGDTGTTKAAYVEEGYPAYSATGRDGYLPYADHDEPGVVLSAIGNCGKTWFASGEWSCIKNTMWFRSARPDVLTEYLYYATADPSRWPTRGAAQPFIALADARRVQVLLPPIEIQRSIVAILAAYDDLITNNTRRIQILEEMARALYREWFVELRFSGDYPQREPPSPAWDKRLIGDLGRVVTGATPSTARSELWGTGVPFITPSDLSGDRPWVRTRRWVSETAATELATRILPAGAVCFTCIASIGASCMTQEESLTNQQINSVVVDEHAADNFFLFHKLLEDKERIRAMASGAATPIINKTAFSSISLEMPPLPLQRMFGDWVRHLYRMVGLLEARSSSLRDARDFLRPRLISGEVDVSNLPMDAAGHVA